MGTGARLLAGLILMAAQLDAGATAMRQGEEAGAALKLSSAAFRHNGEIPLRFTCEGRDISPPLAWTGVPSNAKSLALVVDDPDAPDPANPQTTWVHWVVYDIPPSAAGLAEAMKENSLPPGAREGQNDWQRAGYGGPCPPIGRHRYFFKLYALDIVLPDTGRLSKAGLEAAMNSHVIAQAQLIGTYRKGK